MVPKLMNNKNKVMNKNNYLHKNQKKNQQNNNRI